MPDRALPDVIPKGFTRKTGVPNTPQSKSYFSTTVEAVSRCAADPYCVGMTAQRLFYGPLGTPATIPGRAGEDTCILRN